jgi:hypothetical protein
MAMNTEYSRPPSSESADVNVDAEDGDLEIEMTFHAGSDGPVIPPSSPNSLRSWAPDLISGMTVPRLF